MTTCKRNRKTPCRHCPWKKSSRHTGEDIPNCDIELMRTLANTVGPRGTTQDGFYTIMACHDSGIGEEYPCAGYMAVEGEHNISARIEVARGNAIALYKDEIEKEIGEELYSSFYEMLDDYEDAIAKAEGKQ